MGLSKLANSNSAGVQGSIGAFTSLDNILQVNNFPLGTTLNYLQNGSSAILDLPVGSSVLYAELVWGGLFQSTANNISNLIDNSINFTTPSGTEVISPDVLTSQTFNINVNNITVGFYVRSANVTSILQTSGNGTYSVEGVPALIEALTNRTAGIQSCKWFYTCQFGGWCKHGRRV